MYRIVFLKISSVPGTHRQSLGPGFFSYCHQPGQQPTGGSSGAPCLLPCQVLDKVRATLNFLTALIILSLFF